MYTREELNNLKVDNDFSFFFQVFDIDLSVVCGGFVLFDVWRDASLPRFLRYRLDVNYIGKKQFSEWECINISKTMSTDFYIRYYVGHKGKFGHEFLEFEFRPDGKLRYANNSNYKNDTMIRKEAYVHPCVMEELKRIIVDSEIMHEDDRLWPQPDRVGRQVSKPVHICSIPTSRYKWSCI